MDLHGGASGEGGRGVLGEGDFRLRKRVARKFGVWNFKRASMRAFGKCKEHGGGWRFEVGGLEVEGIEKLAQKSL